MKQIMITSLDQLGLLEKAPQYLANATYLFAGFGVASFVIEIGKVIDIVNTIYS